MAIDTTRLIPLITEFRNSQTKDSISPESLGYLLDRIRDLIASATSTEEVTEAITKKLEQTAYVVTAFGKTEADQERLTINPILRSLTGTSETKSPVILPAATQQTAGVMTAEQTSLLAAADKRAAPLPIHTVQTLMDDPDTEIPDSSTFDIENLLQWVNADSVTQLFAKVVTDTENLQLQVKIGSLWYFASDWGDISELNIASRNRYTLPDALLIDIANSKLYIWYDDQSGLLALATESDIRTIIESKGAAKGLATLDADGRLASAQIPVDAYNICAYASDLPASDLSASELTVSDNEITNNYEIVWLLNADGTGRFAARAVPSIVGQPLYSRWPGYTIICNKSGRPLPNKIYRRMSDNALMALSADSRTKLVHVGGADTSESMKAGQYHLRVSADGILGSRDGGKTWETIWV